MLLTHHDDPFRGKLDTDPLPEEIAERAAEIRANWDNAEELKRRERPPIPWTVHLAGYSKPGTTTAPRIRPLGNLD